MSIKDLEELVNTLRQFIQKARNRDDAFEYCRLCDELRFAEAALSATTTLPEFPRRRILAFS